MTDTDMPAGGLLPAPCECGNCWMTAHVPVKLECLRQRETQMIGAGLSKRNWHETEAAYNQLRDKLDALLSEIRRNHPEAPAQQVKS